MSLLQAHASHDAPARSGSAHGTHNTAALIRSAMNKTDTAKKTSNMFQFVSFSLDKEIFAIDVLKICGVERMLDITAIPGMPEFTDGVINLRNIRKLNNSIVPGIDLRKKFSLPAHPQDKETRIVLIELESKLVIGIIVDSVEEVFQIDQSNIDIVPRVGRPKVDVRYIEGVAHKGDRLIIILNIEKIFSEEETKNLLKIT